ncbi:MAG: ATP-binding protein, partial [Desulfobulbaceae bacterium]|nr:ATP-binding protein [Desulfobulbaceae bacterium]
ASKGIELNMTLGTNMRWLKGDFDQLYQAIMNMMVNGAQSMEQGGVLSIITRQEEGKIVVEIADQGCGLSPEQIRQIFAPFYTSKNKGSGLGLAIVHNIIESHDATISVESEEGVGSAFVVVFESV